VFGYVMILVCYRVVLIRARRDYNAKKEVFVNQTMNSKVKNLREVLDGLHLETHCGILGEFERILSRVRGRDTHCRPCNKLPSDRRLVPRTIVLVPHRHRHPMHNCTPLATLEQSRETRTNI